MEFLIYDLSKKSNWEWWSEIIIPIIGAIALPLLIWFLTWFFGASRAEKKKEIQNQKNSLNYIKSASCYTIINLLTLYQEIQNRIKICLKYNTAKPEEQFSLFSYIVFQNVYDQIDAEKYADLSVKCPQFITNLLQVKYFITDVFETLKLINNSTAKLSNIDQIPAQLIAFKNNFPILSKKIAFAIDKLLLLIHDVEYLQKKLKLADVVEINFTKEEKKQIKQIQKELEATKTKEGQA